MQREQDAPRDEGRITVVTGSSAHPRPSHVSYGVPRTGRAAGVGGHLVNWPVIAATSSGPSLRTLPTSGATG
jgi:hypothetical protein